ncbi:hypothetical protein NDU88_001892 [Pleurodeles waltl]|uniref:Uncharacterized protein n=1 Tax=Pleurodeles waltl TaxID=8319 RepID=A0AAV7U857_PLEWA|nr:hypothetical protein NDU88_001892 [Pleurodeles waltl]
MDPIHCATRSQFSLHVAREMLDARCPRAYVSARYRQDIIHALTRSLSARLNGRCRNSLNIVFILSRLERHAGALADPPASDIVLDPMDHSSAMVLEREQFTTSGKGPKSLDTLRAYRELHWGPNETGLVSVSSSPMAHTKAYGSEGKSLPGTHASLQLDNLSDID